MMTEDKNNFQKWVFRLTPPAQEGVITRPPTEQPRFNQGWENSGGVVVFQVPNPDKPTENKMTTKQQLAEEIKALQEQLDAMPEVLGINFKPEENELYFTIHSDGDIDSGTWRDDDYDKARYAIGNCYPTREAAERIVRNRKTLVKLREFAFLPDFTNDNQDKYHFYIDDEELEPTISDCYNYGEPVCFATDELRIAAREAVGEAAIVDMLEGGLV